MFLDYSSSILFPGEGCEYIGMGKLLFDNFEEAKEVFDIADNQLRFNLSSIIFYGNESDLLPPQIQQPAILTVSTALYRCMHRNIDLSIDYMLGYGIGEITALVCAGMIDFRDGLYLAVKRGDTIEQLLMKDRNRNIHLHGELPQADDLNQIEIFKGEINQIKVSRSKSSKVISAVSGKKYSTKTSVVNNLTKSVIVHKDFSELLNIIINTEHNRLIDIGPSRCWYQIVKNSDVNAGIATMDASGDPFYCFDIIENKKLFNIKYLIGKMIVTSISFENLCFDEQQFHTGVSIPYTRLNEIYDSIEIQDSETKLEMINEAKECLVKIMQIKGLKQEEIQWRLKKLEDETLIPLCS